MALVSRKLWTPLDLGSALVAWYDPSDAATVHTTGGVIDSIDDKSGNGNTLVASGTARPAYGATAFQSHVPGITFDGSNDFLSVLNVALNSDKFAGFVFGQFSDTFPGRLLSIAGDGQSSDSNNIGSVALLINTGGGDLSTKRNNVEANHTPAASLYRLQPGVYFRFGSLNDGVDQKLLTDRIVRNSVAVAGSLSSPVKVGLGAAYDGGLPWLGIVGEVIILNRDPTSAEIELIDNHFLRPWRRVVVAEGDSLTWSPPQGGLNGFAYRYIPNSSPPAFLMNMGTPGIAFNNAGIDVFQRAAAHIDTIIPSNKLAKQYVLTVFTMNNLGGVTGNPVDVAVQYGVYAAARKAAGWDKVVWCTPLSRTDAQANDVNRAILLGIMRGAGWAAANSIDAICDFAADPIMGVDAAPTVNASYFLDEVHPNAAGHVRLETVYRVTINGLSL